MSESRVGLAQPYFKEKTEVKRDIPMIASELLDNHASLNNVISQRSEAHERFIEAEQALRERDVAVEQLCRQRQNLLKELQGFIMPEYEGDDK